MNDDAGTGPVGTVDAGDLTRLQQEAAGWAANEWHEIGDNVLSSVFLTRAEEDAIDPMLWQVSGPASAITIWSSAGFDGTRFFVGAAGGHGGYNGNELYQFDLSTLTWSRLYDPSPTTTCMPSGGGIDCDTQWGPPALHQYDGLTFSTKTNSLFYFGTGDANSCWVWRREIADIKTAWIKFACAPNMPTSYMKSAEDPQSGAIIVFGGGSTGFAALDPVTLTWSRMSSSSATYATYNTADIDPVRRRMYYIGKHNGGPLYQQPTVEAIDIDADPIAVASRTDGAPPAEIPFYACFIYHAKSSLMLAWGGDQKLWTWNPDTDVWTSIATTGITPTTSSTNGGGIGQKCAYLPSVDLFIGIEHENRGAFAIRPQL